MKKASLLLCFLTFFTVTTFAQWSNGMDAEYVIGQPDFISNAEGTGTQGFSYPYDVAIDIENGKMYVADLVNCRVLRYAYPITANNPAAEFVFGQTDFTSTDMNRGGNPAANTLSFPSAVVIQNSTLWICDNFNNRILKFNNAANLSVNGPDADGVLGQPGFTTNAQGTSQNTLWDPYDIAFDNAGNLYVVEANNNRVTRFDNADGKANGANADAVLGQNGFTTNIYGTSQSEFMFPMGVASDGTNLFVSDTENNRVLRFDNAAGKANGANADGVLGQANFTSGDQNRGGAGCAANTLNWPAKPALNSDGTLFVSDWTNNRVLLFENATNKANGADADYVLGQGDFVSNDDELVTQNRIWHPNGLDYDEVNGKLVFADEENCRVLQFAYTTSPPVSVEDEDVMPTEFSLAQNYPNPFNPTTTINYNISVESHVMLKIYDILGNEVASLVNEILPAGNYKAQFDASDLSTGIYIYQIIAGNFSAAKQMMLLK